MESLTKESVERMAGLMNEADIPTDNRFWYCSEDQFIKLMRLNGFSDKQIEAAIKRMERGENA